MVLVEGGNVLHYVKRDGKLSMGKCPENKPGGYNILGKCPRLSYIKNKIWRQRILCRRSFTGESKKGRPGGRPHIGT